MGERLSTLLYKGRSCSQSVFVDYERRCKMESLGVISKVDSPTPWCAGMIVVQKKSGAVCICVDFRPLT